MNNRKQLKTDTLIIGAGPAGLATAMELFKAGKDFIVIEKEDTVGGLSRTYSFKENDGAIFLTDNGPHRFFSKNPYLYSFIEDLIKEKWITVPRYTRQYIDGKFYDYPINALQALRNIGIFRAIKMGVDYILAFIEYRICDKEINNFEDYVVANFGKSLGRFNMINYTEKIWGIPANTIHPDWAKQRIKGLNLVSLVVNVIKKIFSGNSGDTPKSLVDEFYYPQFGTGLIYEAIYKKIVDGGRIVLLNHYPVSIEHNDGHIGKIILNGPEGEIEVICNNLVESVPITSFVGLLDPEIPQEVNEAIKRLRHRSQVYVFITLNRDSVTKDQWIYFPSTNVPISRMSEMRNFSKDMSPEGKTSLFVEFFCFENDSIWNSSDKDLTNLTIDFLEKEKFINKSEVRKSYVIRKKDAYPVYDLDYKNYLSIVQNYLDQFSNLYYIGRPGRFRYNNQDHSLEMGILAAKSIIENKRYDIERVGDEDEYYESGVIPKKS